VIFLRKPRFLVAVTLCLCLSGFTASAATYIDALGRAVDIPPSPQRIVSLAPNITETLFALGLDSEVVGVTMDSTLPQAVKDLPRVGGLASLSLERIIALEPDCIIATADGNPKETVLQLARAGFPVYVIHPGDLDGMLQMILDLGEITGRRERAEQLVSSLRRRIDAVVAGTAGREKPRVFFQISYDPLITVGRGTFHDRLIEMAGGINIFGDSPVRYPRVSLEMVIFGEPDVIIYASMAPEEKHESAVLKRWKKWSSVPAVASGRIYCIDADIIHQPAPSVVMGLEILADLLHRGRRGEDGDHVVPHGQVGEARETPDESP